VVVHSNLWQLHLIVQKLVHKTTAKVTAAITGVFQGLFKVVKPLGEYLGGVLLGPLKKLQQLWKSCKNIWWFKVVRVYQCS
jgi:hypothetical protein